MFENHDLNAYAHYEARMICKDSRIFIGKLKSALSGVLVSAENFTW
jgi:hypothetical protein